MHSRNRRQRCPGLNTVRRSVECSLGLIALLVGIEARAQSCEAMPRRIEVVTLSRALGAASAVGPVWSDFTLADHPVIFLDQPADTAARGCATIWRAGSELRAVALTQRVRLSTPLYGMWNGEPPGPNPNANGTAIAATVSRLPPELEAEMRRLGYSRAIILPVPLRFEALGSLGKALVAMHADPTVMLTQLAVHESYHLHSQIPVWLDQPHQYDWPRWDVQPDRKVLVEQCYAAPGVMTAHRAELAALLSAWDLVADSAQRFDSAAVRSAAQRFIALRHERYRILDSVRVPSPSGPLPCSVAENLMELEEGAPQWMSYDTAVRAGVMQVSQAGRSANDAFYVSGTFQL